MAGYHTLAADPPNRQYVGLAMPSGSMPIGKVTFRLPTPSDRGIGVQIGQFRPPEKNAYMVAAEERAGSFARGIGPCLHYRHMQQSSKYLIPSQPSMSRTEEGARVHAKAKSFEIQRAMTLESLEQNEQRRQTRLRQAKMLLQTRTFSKEIAQKLQASCSLPELGADPCGEQTPVLELLNRRVDVNRLKKCRREMAEQQNKQVVKQAVVQTPDLKELIDDISRFESDNLPDLNVVLETVVDWKNSTTISFNADPQGAAACATAGLSISF